MRYNSQTRKSTHLVCTNIFPELYNHHHYFQSNFIFPKRNPLPFNSHSPSPSLMALAATNLSASMNLPILDTSYK